MASKALIPSKFTVSCLRSLLASIGAPVTGTKPVLMDRLMQEMRMPPPKDCRVRVLSVDMGIRNLAYCVVDAEVASSNSTILQRVKAGPQRGGKTEFSSDVTPKGDILMHIEDWKRMVVDLTSPSCNTSRSEGSLFQKGNSSLETFTPASLSYAAYKLAVSFLDYKPDIILIERQRFRSGGSAAIQEWTVRVNMLESMLWAVLETLRAQAGSAGVSLAAPRVEAMLPSRVTSFWLGTEQGRNRLAHTTSSGRRSTSAASKKAKIALVRGWICSEHSADDGHPKKFMFTFSESAEATKSTFCTSLGSGGERAKGTLKKMRKKAVAGREVTEGTESEASAMRKNIGKLDDLADCVLQAAAWVQWRANRRSLLEIGPPGVKWAIDNSNMNVEELAKREERANISLKKKEKQGYNSTG